MFTGIINEVGTIEQVRTDGDGRRIRIAAPDTARDLEPGASVSINGCCLSAERIEGEAFELYATPETLRRSTLGGLSRGARVNLELALRPSDRLGGHFVQGHVDGMGEVAAVKEVGGSWVFTFRAPSAVARYLVEKGSVAVDGISLTINHCDRSGFTVAVIPHTAAVTTIGLRRVGDRVNLETDMIGKYVARFVRPDATDPLTRPAGETEAKGTIDRDLLARKGFL